jgi:hypothetical protein
MPVEAFLGSVSDPTLASKMTPAGFMEVVVKTAVEQLSRSSAFVRPDEGTPHRRILTTLPAVMIPLKLAIVAERWKMTLETAEANRLVLWREAPEPPKPTKGGSRTIQMRPPTGLEVVIHMPAPPSAECLAIGTLRGDPDLRFRETAVADIPQILDDLRGRLQNVEERRAYPRYPAEIPVRVFPLYDDGVVGPPMDGQCREVSMAGIRLLTPHPVHVQRIYIEFPELTPLNGQTIYSRVLRTWQDPEGRGTMTAGRITLE